MRVQRTEMTVERAWLGGEWPDQATTGYSHRGKTFVPTRVTLTVARTTETFNGIRFAATVTGPLRKQNGEPAGSYAEARWTTGVGSNWADRPAWVAELVDPLIAEIVAGTPFDLPAVTK